MYVIVGLGNPGKTYSNTRHNVGFNTVDLLAERNNIEINKIKFKSVYGEGRINGKKIILVKPQTYMNNSGEAVRDIANFYKLDPSKIIVIVDDIDIDFASVRIRKNGSAGSHNGLKSIIRLLGRDDFPRIKIGIGKKHPQQNLADFVLSRFSKDEVEDIEDAIRDSAEAVELILKEDIDMAMNEFNRRKKAQD